MKTLILALLLLVVVSQSEALRCYCGGRKICSSKTETCYGTDQVCASIVFHFDATSAQGCYSASNCRLMNQPGLITTSCCTTDLCNR
ncbi:toxin 3FTx-Oxy5-like [Stegastes partitus]|uniref:Toxin 3FTx-Oxy5-like n=1 Tax=Stegastes partitus TaxID=144197 RepID=A0A9Y4NG79_9TELE|nr:PREDICTED: toxin 3FTx-Oxy5-like [Stegastes partitus]